MEQTLLPEGVSYQQLTQHSSEPMGSKPSFEQIWFIRVLDGQAQALINYAPYTLPIGSCWLLTEEVSFRLQSCSDSFNADVLCLSIRFLDSIYYSIGPLIAFTMSIARTDMMPSAYHDLIDKSFSLFIQTLRSPIETGKVQMLRALSTQLLLAFSSGYTKQVEADSNERSGGRPQVLLNKFIALILKQPLPHRRDTGYYAGRLNISTRYLYRICKDITDQSPKEIIDGILIGGIKQALSASIRPIRDIALDYGFEDPTAFGQYFKRHTGSTPSAFRNE